MKLLSVLWLPEEWDNLSWKEALLQFYYSSMKGKLYFQGTYTATLFSTLNLTLICKRQGEKVLLVVQLKADLSPRESDWTFAVFGGSSHKCRFKTLCWD